MTRPESWALLAQTVPETIKLLTRAGGKASVKRLDPIFFADSPAGQQALAFVESAATGLGPVIEPLPAGLLGSERGGLILRDAVYLQRGQLEPILDQWLEGLNVARVPLAHTTSVVADDGSVRIVHDETVFVAMQAILADDETIARHLPGERLAQVFQDQTMTSILTEPTLPMAASMMLQVDTDLSLVQGAHGGITAIGAGETEACSAQIGVLLGANRHLRQAGGVQHQRLRGRDGAAVLGRLGSGPVVLGGLGPSGAFLAPALARWLAGVAQPEEAEYFVARSAARAMQGSVVAEYLPVGAILAAA